MIVKKTQLKENNKIQNAHSTIDKNLVKSALNSNYFNKIPPIIGIIVADQYGNTLIVLEYDSEQESNYGAIKSYITEDTKNLLEVDLISMYFSSFKAFASQTNIQNLSHLEIYGSNIIIQIYFLLENYMIILFLNSNTDLSTLDKAHILYYFKEKLIKYNDELKDFNTSNSKRILKNIEKKGKIWLKNFNKVYLRNFENVYLKKHKEIEKFVRMISPMIENDLLEYLKYIPEEKINDLLKEIKNKIADQLFEIKLS